ncbi:MAG: DNA polymerase III subunit delta [Cytophagales bacterium]|nr:DNA polymerase III subunit delta [Bernardetiaceae bacterium]MDW8203699.1 DNA polymerase III subunit delta [Cytophagales bacterium]
MSAQAESVLKDLKAGKIAAVYFLQGDEPYYIDLLSNYIEHEFLRPEERGFNLTVLYGKDTNMQNILNAARRFPVMAQRQVVLVKEAQEMSEWNSEKAKEMLLRYVEKPVPSTLLMFCYKYKKIDARTQLAKALAKNAVIVETKKIYDNQLPNWAKQYFASKGYRSSEKANAMLAEFIGNDLSRMANEIDKLLINFPQPQVTITDEEVARYVGISKEYNSFELQNAIARRDSLKVYQIVNYFAADPKNNPAIPIIAILFNFFTKILQIHDSADKSKPAVASLLGINPYFVEEYLATARIYTREKAIQAIHLLYQADCRAKGIDSTMNDGDILQELAYHLLQL